MTPSPIDLGVRPTPLERWRVDDVSLLVKRDDLSAPTLGGNKVRALEFLLAGVPAGETVLTVGATGSTHALAVATYAAQRAARTEVITWPQEEHAISAATARALRDVAHVTHAGSVAEAYARAAMRRLRRDVHWIPAGGSVPLGALGHVRAAMELAEQLESTGAPDPLLVAPLGSGGTIAGLLAGLAIVGRPLPVIGVQVVPRVVARRGRVIRLARQTAALFARRAWDDTASIDARLLQVWRGAYGGAYGRETEATRRAAEAFARAGGPRLEPTYSAKAFAVALERARASPASPVLFWLTFDGRWLRRSVSQPVDQSRGATDLSRPVTDRLTD